MTARQQNDPAIGKISIYAEGERLVSAKQEGSTILTRLGDALSSFFGYVKGDVYKRQIQNSRERRQMNCLSRIKAGVSLLR